jgi:hypothetical protein
MNVLFDEENNILAEHAADALIPEVSYEYIVTHHESFMHNSLEEIVNTIGGFACGPSVRLKLEEKNV